MRGKIKNIVSVIAILLVANSLIHIGSNDIKNGIDKVGAYILCIIFGVILLGICRLLLVQAQQQGRYNKKTMVWGTLAFTIVISYIAPLNYIAYKNVPLKVTIEATGEKNQASQGTEVWIKSIQIDDKSIDLQALVEDNEWEFKNGKLVSYQNQPKQLSQLLECKDSIKIELVKHPYSGKAIVSIGNESSELDLYSNVEHTKFIEKEAEKLPIVSVTIIIYIGWFILEILLSMISCLLILILCKNGGKHSKNINILIILTSILTVNFFFNLASFILNILVSIMFAFILISLNSKIGKVKSKVDIRY